MTAWLGISVNPEYIVSSKGERGNKSTLAVSEKQIEDNFKTIVLLLLLKINETCN